MPIAASSRASAAKTPNSVAPMRCGITSSRTCQAKVLTRETGTAGSTARIDSRSSGSNAWASPAVRTTSVDALGPKGPAGCASGR